MIKQSHFVATKSVTIDYNEFCGPGIIPGINAAACRKTDAGRPASWTPVSAVKIPLNRYGTGRKCRKCRTIRAKRSKDHAEPATISTIVTEPAVGRLSPTPATSIHRSRYACIEQPGAESPRINQPANLVEGFG